MNPTEIVAILRFFAFEHLRDGLPKQVSRVFHDLAHDLARVLPRDPETAVALRKLLEAKDAAVRSALEIDITT